jgi:hypothetical protein
LITETERVKEPNRWEGIFYYPDAAPESKFVATVIEGRRTRTIGLFANLESAVEARARFVEYHANTDKRFEPRKEYATFVDPNLETRTY